MPSQGVSYLSALQQGDAELLGGNKGSILGMLRLLKNTRDSMKNTVQAPDRMSML